MINGSVMFNLADLNDLPAYERWYKRNHAAEVMARFGPWQERYVSYMAVPVPEEYTKRFGVFNYRYTQSWFREIPGYPTDSLSFDMPKFATREDENMIVSFDLPPQATEEFKGASLTPEDSSYIRWVNLIKYPEGVDPEEADEFYLNTMAPEITKQEGLLRYFSYKVLPADGPLPGWKSTEETGEGPNPPQFHRFSELWYANYDSWKANVIDNPPAYTKPPWAEVDEYPFLTPFDSFISMFIMESPTNDFQRELLPYV